MARVINFHNEQPTPFSVWVGRPSKWGNNFVLHKHGTREQVLKWHEAWFRNKPDLLRQIIDELGGRDLICSCAPEACHADLYLRLANGTKQELIAWAGYDPYAMWKHQEGR